MASTGGQLDLEDIIIRAVNQMLEAGPVKSSEIYEMVAVGNTVMRDLFAGFPVKSLGRAPYEPFSPGPVRRKAHERGILGHPLADIYLPPVLGHFVGADMLAVLLAVGMHNSSGTSMAIDIGTTPRLQSGTGRAYSLHHVLPDRPLKDQEYHAGRGQLKGLLLK